MRVGGAADTHRVALCRIRARLGDGVYPFEFCWKHTRRRTKGLERLACVRFGQKYYGHGSKKKEAGTDLDWYVYVHVNAYSEAQTRWIYHQKPSSKHMGHHGTCLRYVYHVSGSYRAHIFTDYVCHKGAYTHTYLISSPMTASTIMLAGLQLEANT